MTINGEATQWVSLGAAGALLVGLLRLTQRYVGVITGGALDRAKSLDLKVTELEHQIDLLRQALADERERCETRMRALEQTLRAHNKGEPT
jgi:hypothetical protein